MPKSVLKSESFFLVLQISQITRLSSRQLTSLVQYQKITLYEDILIKISRKIACEISIDELLEAK